MAHEEFIAKTNPQAPLWQGFDQDYLAAITKHLSDASYHYADDSRGEWGKARESLRKACSMANDAGLRFHALELLHGHAPQLVSLTDFIDGVLMEARK